MSRFIALLFLLLPYVAYAAPSPCQLPATSPLVNVTWEFTPLVMNYNLTYRELRGKGPPTIIVPGYGSENALTEGLTVAQIHFGGGGSKLAIQQSTDKSVNCFFYAEINMHIKVDPTIFIAREVPQNTCMSQAIHNHEMRHYDTVYHLTKQYREVLQQELVNFIRETGLRGPYNEIQQQAAIQEREKRLADLVNATYERLLADNKRLQATIDNVDEYRRVANLCQPQQ